jgi:hypothetical protein
VTHPPSCRQRIVLIPAVADRDAPGEILLTLPAGVLGSRVREELRKAADAHPGRLVAAEHQQCSWSPDWWVRYLWVGGDVVPRALEEDRKRRQRLTEEYDRERTERDAARAAKRRRQQQAREIAYLQSLRGRRRKHT